jgi:hypothetical protein
MLQLMTRKCQYCFKNKVDGTTRWIMYNLVAGNGNDFVEAVRNYWDEKDLACKVTALQKQARLDGFP